MWLWLDRPLQLRPLFSLAVLSILAVAVSGCGYRFSAGPQQSSPMVLGPGFRTMAIQEVENPATLPWLEAELRAMVKEEFAKRGLVTWTSRDKAQVLLKLRVLRYENLAKVRNRRDKTLKKIAEIDMEATVHSAHDNTLLWSSGTLSAYESFVSMDERVAVKRILALLTRELSDRMRHAF